MARRDPVNEARMRYLGQFIRETELQNQADMAFVIEGTIKTKMAAQSGESQNGPWARQDFVLEYQDGNYISAVCFNAWGVDMVTTLASIPVGYKVKVHFSVRAREYNGRWFNDIRPFKIEQAGAMQPAPQQYAPQPVAPAPQQYAPQPTPQQYAPQPVAQPTPQHTPLYQQAAQMPTRTAAPQPAPQAMPEEFPF